MPSFLPNLLTQAIIIFDWHATSVHYSVRIDIPPPLLLLLMPVLLLLLVFDEVTYLFLEITLD